MASIVPKASNLVAQILSKGKPKVQTFLYFAKVELTPPRLSDIPEITRGIGRILNAYKSGAWKQLTVKEALLNGLVATEVFCWFYIGECIGKRHIVGYKLL